ncbi:MAG: hypothetical protein V7K89_00290 [Nostoc sp.]|uniref:hypothetical protein n=1 Tax=Nostoc sp. TaxID=1180 RepID=UPI002FF5F27E
MLTFIKNLFQKLATLLGLLMVSQYGTDIWGSGKSGLALLRVCKSVVCDWLVVV